jgi:cell division protein FtsZ
MLSGSGPPAAKVITESIDPQAKVIFGTVRDDKLKKNEVKVTVIAAGFPEGSPAALATGQKQTFAQQNEAPARDEKREDKKEKGRIFNSMSSVLPIKDIKEKAPVMEEKKEVAPKIDDDDDWGAVPAFLRRSKLK